MQQIKIHRCFISISCLAKEAVVLFLKSKQMLLKSNKCLLRVCSQFLAKQISFMKTKSIPLHHKHTHQHMLALGLSTSDFVHSTFVHLLLQHWTFLLHHNYLFLIVVNHHLLKFHVITSARFIQNAGCACSPLLYIARHFNAVLFNLVFLEYHYHEQTFVYTTSFVNAS